MTSAQQYDSDPAVIWFIAGPLDGVERPHVPTESRVTPPDVIEHEDVEYERQGYVHQIRAYVYLPKGYLEGAAMPATGWGSLHECPGCQVTWRGPEYRCWLCGKERPPSEGV